MSRVKDRLHRAIVIGATPSGIAAANKLGELGIPVTLVDMDPDLDKKLAKEEWVLKTGIPLNHAHRPGLIRILRNPGITCILPAKVNNIKHSSQGFRVNITKEQTFIDPEKCILCGRCTEVCPVITGENEKAVNFGSRLSLPGHPVIDKRRLPLCRENCPLGVNAQGYLALTKQGKYIEALELILEKNILPGICGRVCNHPCEDDCRRGQLDDPVAIRNIKRFVADYGAEHPGKIKIKKIQEKRPERFAVIGSGPSGLAAAADLARAGCGVTIFEKEKMAGGLLRYGIGPHRLPRNILDAELDYIKTLGVEFVTDHPVNLSKDIKKLSKEYKGVIISTGSWKDRPLGIKGQELEGVEGCLEFLGKYYRGEFTELKEKAAVIGDGNAAFDLSRTLSRIGADVTILSWFGMEEIPADPEEIRGAAEEGIAIKSSTQVIEFVGENGKLKHLRCKSTKPGTPDQNSIAWPVIDKESKTFTLEFDKVFISIGQTGPFEPGAKNQGVKINKSGFISVDNNFRTSIPNVYAAGDAVTGPSTVVRAMANGRAAAARALADICGIKSCEPVITRPQNRDFPEIPTDIPTLNRADMPEKQPKGREHNFAEVALGLSETQVLYEAGRCLQCGCCAECMQCVEICGAIQAIDHGEPEEEIVEHAGAVIIADPEMYSQIKGDDVIRAYGPKTSKTDVYAMLMRGYAAAAQTMLLLGNKSLMLKGNSVSFYQPDPRLSPDIRIGVFVCKCNDSLGWSQEMDQYVEGLNNIQDVVHAQTINSACISEGASEIIKAVRDKGITRIVLGSCVCCPLNFVCSACTDQRSRLKHKLFTATGISRSMVITRNIRGEALSLLKKDPSQALKKFKGLIDRSIRSSLSLKKFPTPARLYNFTAAVIGQSEPAVTSATTLADAGMDVFMFGTPDNPLTEGPEHPNIHCFEGSAVSQFRGTLGDFKIDIETNNFKQSIQVGAVIIGEKARKKIKYAHQQGLDCRVVESGMQEAGVTGIPFFYPGNTSVSGLFLADPPGISISNKQKGAAAAVLAAAAMPQGPRQSKGFTVSVNEEICRSCGRCIEVCPYQAVIMKPNEIGGWYALVDEAFCKGCGNCISVCPSSAADSPYRDQKFFEQTLEEILLQ
ncbi:4Fe-4S ferredoxin iron-sulfur protein [Desulfonema limicola]|uniref:4Fe-4S ferredoxin iron-sulfur protein n=1 Tax=Desulfonema limicola TaxID=45656 RepID=A0A975GFG4_9BACT|nr:FAD-dependent oxidoreductase [Desulfonema limicola]QTA79155.1 4Fe-4S ferredoxin iron-sulfur protein [Desulfonema limicola]